MIKLERCPLCGGEVMLCKEGGAYAYVPMFSVVCTECAMKFEIVDNPITQTEFNATKVMERLVNAFNRRPQKNVDDIKDE